MSELLAKCEVCGSLLDEEDVFCANCGAESPCRTEAARHTEDSRAAADSSRLATHNFECSGCGASMSFDARAGTLRCPFCASLDMAQQKDTKVLAPRRVVPFRLSREEAVATMRKWLGRGFFRPSGLSQQASVVQMQPVYVPYWVFEATTHTYWTADSSRTPARADGDWFPMSGEHRGRYSNLLIGASGALTPAETAAIGPFDLSQGVPPDKLDLQNVTVEQFSVPRKYARPLARSGLEQMEAEGCAQEVPGRSRNLHVNVRIESMSSEPALLPVWIMAYRYKERLYRFLANGQSGRSTGKAPTSWLKILTIAAAVVLAVLILLICSRALGVELSRKADTSNSCEAPIGQLGTNWTCPFWANRRAILAEPSLGPPPTSGRFLLYWPVGLDFLTFRANRIDDEPRTDSPAAGWFSGRGSGSAPPADAGDGGPADGV